MQTIKERMMVALLALTACGDVVVAAEAKRSFETVPKQALVELKATVGRPFSSGLVFIDGKYLAPPYKVERYGTALRVNGQQVTGQIIRWDEFLKTQTGVRVEQMEQTASAESAVVEPVAEEVVSEDDLSDDFDDLFDDNPKPKKKAPRAAAKKPAPRPSAPATTIVFDGEFKPNAKTKAMLEKLNKSRTNLEQSLRRGRSCFFSSRYATVTADRGPTDIFLAAIPQVMKDSSSFEAFSSAARARGVTFLSDIVMRDLFRNRLDYIRLQDRAKVVKDERKWETMLNSAN